MECLRGVASTVSRFEIYWAWIFHSYHYRSFLPVNSNLWIKKSRGGRLSKFCFLFHLLSPPTLLHASPVSPFLILSNRVLSALPILQYLGIFQVGYINQALHKCENIQSVRLEGSSGPSHPAFEIAKSR